jgi:alpha-D-ribose 1-methylphosphonate 5-triphosphate diphosphatase PhnM
LNAATALRLTDRGAIRTGLLADLLLVREGASGLPEVEAAFRAGDEVFRLRVVAREGVAA